MKWVNNMKISMRMVLSFAIVFVLYVSVTLIAMTEINSLNAKFTDLMDESVGLSTLVEESEKTRNFLSVKLMQMTTYGYDEAVFNEMAPYVATMQTLRVDIKNMYPGTDGLADEYVRTIESAEAVFQKSVPLLQSGDVDEVLDIIEDEFLPAFDEAVAVGTDLQTKIQQNIEATYLEIETTTIRNQITILIISIVVLLFIVFIATSLISGISKPLKQAEAAVVAFAKGDLSFDVKYVSNSELGNVCQAVRDAQAVTKTVMGDIVSTTGNLMDGNLDFTVDTDYPGEYSPIKTNLNTLTDHMNNIMSQIRDMSEQVSAGSEQVSSGAQALAQGSTEQAEAVERLTYTIGEMDKNAKQNVSTASDAKEKANQAASQIQVCNDRMHEMQDAMNDILAGQRNISEIIATIENISFQTNILALNAAVEAARAGSAGKGFAVVADEVRNLASKSDEAAKQTTKLIEDSMNYVNRGSKIAKEVEINMDKTVEYTHQAIQSMEVMAENALAEAASIDNIAVTMEQISAVVQTNSATSEESAAASEQLSSQSQLMRQSVSRFKLKGSNDKGFGSSSKYDTQSYMPVEEPAYSSNSSYSFREDINDKY